MSGRERGVEEGSLLQLAAESDRFADALAATLRVACGSGDWEYAETWLREGNDLVAGPVYDPAGRFAAVTEPSVDTPESPDGGVVARAVATGEVTWLDDTDDSETVARVLAATDGGLASAVGIPVVTEDGSVAAVCAFYSSHEHPVDEGFEPAVVDAVSTFGRLFAGDAVPARDTDERALLDEVLQTSPVGILVHDPECGTERANPAAASILGVDVDTILDRGLDSEVWDVRDEAGQQVAVDTFPFAEVLAERGPIVDQRFVVGRPDGTEATLSVNAAPVFDETGAITRVIVMFSDVSERADHEAELEEKNRQLEAFASVLSHDIRSPLAVATGFLELAEETGDLSYLEKVEASHERIEELVDTLLVLARRGRMVGKREPVDLAAAAREAWAGTETKDATLEVGDVGEIEADPVRLRQVFENLFRNSVEHGGTDVTTRVFPLDGEPGFAVEDDGPGIPVEKREELLRPGHEAAGGGFGLGLSIVAAVAEGHDWDLRATEGADGGARFEFRTAAGAGGTAGE